MAKAWLAAPRLAAELSSFCEAEPAEGRVSNRFIAAVKLSKTRAYRLANQAEIHPSVLSKWLNGAERVRPNDARVIAVGRAVGLTPDQCFQDSPDAQGNEPVNG
jgi:hypothetical protein